MSELIFRAVKRKFYKHQAFETIKLKIQNHKLIIKDYQNEIEVVWLQFEIKLRTKHDSGITFELQKHSRYIRDKKILKTNKELKSRLSPAPFICVVRLYAACNIIKGRNDTFMQ